MPKATHPAVYNSRNLGMVMPFSSRRFRSLWMIAILLPAAFSFGQNWSGPAEQLAGKIVAVTGTQAITVEVSNRSSLATASADEIRRGLLTQLAVHGARFASAQQAAASVQVSLSENLQSYVWVAEVRQGTNAPAVVMVSFPRAPSVAVEPAGFAMVLHKVQLWSQPERILDVAALEGSPAKMLVLDASGVIAYRLQDGRWQAEQPLPIPHSRPWPRDLRGRLVLAKDLSAKDRRFDAYLPGVFCRSTSPEAMTCYDGDQAWPIGNDVAGLNAPFTASRNYFSGVLSPGVGKQTTVPPFYSAAGLLRDQPPGDKPVGDKYAVWLFAAVDGQLHLLNGSTDQVVTDAAWGSDIAALHSGCESGWQVLATGAGDAANDAVRAFEVPGRTPVAMSAPLDIGGRVTAMWTESSGAGVVAIMHNSRTGEYEALRLTATCGR
ncbi:MAG: hypothetical protein ACRD3H_00490 [Terriglobales bacterium]